MRCISATIFIVMFALALTLMAASHLVESRVEMPTKHPTSPEWLEHRNHAKELEKRMRECNDPVEVEKLCRQHSALLEQWKKNQAYLLK